MAENNLQNQKNEVSFVLSDNAKTIIEKFEGKLRESNYTAEEKNGIRAELVWQLLGQRFPEIVKKVEEIEVLSLSHLQNAKVVLEVLRKEEPLLSLGLVLLHSVVPIQEYGILEKEKIETLYDVIPAVVDYYCYVIVNYDAAYSVFKNKYFELCMRLYGRANKVELLHNDDTSYPLWWVLLSMDTNNTPYTKRNRYVPKERFDLVILSEDEDSADESTFYLNGNTFQMNDFISNHLSMDGTLFYKAPDSCINNAAWFSFRKWVVENGFLHGVIQLPHTKEGGQILIINKRKADSVFFVNATQDFWEGNILNTEKLLEAILEKNPYYYKEIAIEDYVSHNSNYDTFVLRQFARQLIPTPKEGEVLASLRDLVDVYESEIEEDVSCYFLNKPYYFKNDLHESLEAVMMPQARRVPNEKFFLFKWDDDVIGYEPSCACAYQTELYDFNCDSSTGVEYPSDSNYNPIICTYPNAIVFKLKETPSVPIDPYYLTKLLSSSREVFAQLECYKLPYRDCIMETEDFLSVVVAIPPMEEQQRILNMDGQNLQKVMVSTFSISESNDRIKVLWIGYDKTLEKVSPSLVEISITKHQCWDDAKKLLDNRDDFSQWSAIVFGPHFKIGPATPSSSKNVLRFSRDLSNLSTKNNSEIPWYVVIDGNDSFLSNLYCDFDQLMDRESDWGDFMYNMDSKEQMLSLIETIKKVDPFKNSRNRIKHQYRKVMDVIRDYFEPESETIMIDILSALHYPEENKDFQPVLYYNLLRHMIEYLFRAANVFGLIPDYFIEDGRVNLTGCSLYLSGKEFNPSKKSDIQSIYYEGGERVFDENIEKIVKNILDITHHHSHTTNINKEDEKELSAYYSETRSPYLLFGFTIQLCEVIIWFGNYVKTHGDRESNLAKCVVKKKFPVEKKSESTISEYEGKTFLLEQDEKGNLHCGYCMVSHNQHQDKIEKMVRLHKIEENDKDTREVYPYFAKKVELVKSE
jgi:hypothetical protein